MTASLPDPLVVMALQVESQGKFEEAGVPVLYTGVGKINAAWALTRKLSEYRHANRNLPLVLNFGTSGSRSFATHSTVSCCKFVQHDMDVTGLGFGHGTTPYDSVPASIEFPNMFPDLVQAVCGSGDCFSTKPPAVACEVVDMEAYALAKVCYLEGARFACVKYVTDGADHSAATDWQANLRAASEQFLSFYSRIVRSD